MEVEVSDALRHDSDLLSCPRVLRDDSYGDGRRDGADRRGRKGHGLRQSRVRDASEEEEGKQDHDASTRLDRTGRAEVEAKRRRMAGHEGTKQ